MKQTLFVLSVMLTLLAACVAPPANTMPAPTETSIPALAASPVPAATATDAVPSSKLPAAPFDSQTYINEKLGFALDYPAGWTVTEQVIGERGSQVLFLSAPDLADMPTMPQGATRLSATIYQWDPKNDLAAFVAHQKEAWTASGSTVLSEEQRVLELGVPAMQFIVQAPDENVIYLIAAIGDQYLVLSGEGDLELAQEIVQRVRPILVK